MRLPGSLRIRNWRDFLAEIVVVVIGVLIALAAGDVAEEWGWQHKVTNGERQLLSEARINMGFAAEQAVVGPCLDAQLVVLRDRVIASGDTLAPAPVYKEEGMWSYTFRMPTRPYSDGIWRSLNDDGTSVHMAGDRQQIRAGLYEQLESLRHLRAESDLVTGRMLSLAHPLPLDAGTRARHVESIEEQRARSRLQSLIASQLLGAFRDLGMSGTEPRVEARVSGSGTIAFCRKHGLPMADWRKIMAAQPHALSAD